LILEECSLKLGLNVAVSETGRNWLKKEFLVIQNINTNCKLPYLPEVYFFDEQETMSFLLEEWFEDYHEFHIAKTEDGQQQIKLWKYGKGNRFLSSEQGFEIYLQAAQILTLYYDLKDFRLIYPWHHAAGDFVVKIEDQNNSPSPTPSHQGRGNKREDSFRGREDKREIFYRGRRHSSLIPSTLAGEGKGEEYFQDKIDVRLTTVRGYESFMGRDKDDMVNPTVALFYFLLHLSIQMRIDRLDGVGIFVWADDSCVDATIAGFFEGLEKKKDLRDCCRSAMSFLMLLKSFTKEDLRKTFVPVAEQFEQTKDYRIIQRHLKNHADKLYLTLQNFPL
jgi:hypothetical protein